MSKEIDSKVVESIRKSKEIVGYLRPCIRDQNGNLRAGKHRKLADPNWPEEVKHIKDELDGLLINLHDNVQRTIPQEETKEIHLQIAQLLETKGVPIGKICAEVCKLSPYTDRYVRELLPQKYKQEHEKSEVVPTLRENIKKLGRVEASRLLSEHLKKLEEEGKIVKAPEAKDEFAETITEITKPFPDCKCSECSHYTKCYPI